ncbi:hypothetical protein Agau_P200171 (plasmid) [Agrobacterium tumefaciens F2]|nr:hypothetical protein Agau_P200171 [Agrobacterium tumefaciens F2]
MSMTNALVGADRMAALPSRAYSRTSGNPGFTAPPWRAVERKEWERFETNRLAACLYRPHLIRRRAAGLVPRACRLRPPDQKGLHVTIADTAPRR